MLRGICVFKCDECGKRFVVPDIELGATILSAPAKCPQCSSMHTRPLFSSKKQYEEIWKLGNKK